MSKRAYLPGRILSRKQADTIGFDSRVVIEEHGGGGTGLRQFFTLTLQQLNREANPADPPVVESAGLAGQWHSRSEADEAAVAVLTALTQLKWWRKP